MDSNEFYNFVDAAIAIGVCHDAVVLAAMSGVLNAKFIPSQYKWMVSAADLAEWAKTMRKADSVEQCVTDLAFIFNLCPLDLKRAIQSHKVIGQRDMYGNWKAHAPVVLKWMQGRILDLKSPNVPGWKELSEQGFLSYREAAELCGMTPTRLYIAVTKQELKRYYINSLGRHFFKYEDIQAWMAVRGKTLKPRAAAVVEEFEHMKADIDRLSSELGEAHGVINMVAGKVSEFAVRH
jgi:hypothetical protein